MRFVAALDTIIFGVTYAQGAEVDTSTWTRKMLLQFLSNGIIQAAHLTAGSISDKLVFEGDGVTYTINSQGQVVVDIDPPVPAFADLSDVNLAGLDNGDVPTWNESAGEWRPGSGGGGGGNGTQDDARWTIPSGVTSIDEFDAGTTLDPAWVRADGTGALASNAIWAQGAGGLSVRNLGAADAASKMRALLRPITSGPVAAGDAFETCLTLFGPDRISYTMGGVMLSTTDVFGSGTQVMAFSFVTTTGVTNDTRPLTGFTAGTASTTINTSTMRLFTRLVKLAGNLWRTDVSPDGVQWIPGGTITLAFTPTYVGFVNGNWAFATKGIVRYEYLRRYSGVT